MKIRFVPSWHVNDREYLEKHKPRVMRMISLWNKKGRPQACIYTDEIKPEYQRITTWTQFRMPRMANNRREYDHRVIMAIYIEGGKRIAEFAFDIL